MLMPGWENTLCLRCTSHRPLHRPRCFPVAVVCNDSRKDVCRAHLTPPRKNTLAVVMGGNKGRVLGGSRPLMVLESTQNLLRKAAWALAPHQVPWPLGAESPVSAAGVWAVRCLAVRCRAGEQPPFPCMFSPSRLLSDRALLHPT